MKNEIWIPIKGYENIYMISNNGRIKSLNKIVNAKNNSKALKKGKLIETNSLRKGYKYVQLYDNNGKVIKFSIHRLIALHFIPNPNNFPQINHIDGNTLNNSINNLEWCTASYNTQHAFKTGLIKIRKGNECTQSKLKEHEIKEIFNLNSKGVISKHISEMYNISQQSICDILKRRTWKHVTIELEGYVFSTNKEV